MMKILLYLISFFLLNYFGECIQPYFPPQIVFSPDNNGTIFAIDTINQRAYKTHRDDSTGQESSFVMQHFPYAPVNSPQSKYYVQLLVDSVPFNCMYGTYWKYGGNQYNSFPSHWWVNMTSFEIKNYLQFNYEMIHSTNSSEDEDHWYANETCMIYNGTTYPCQEIYFKKNTDIPLRLVQVVRWGWAVLRLTTSYQIISIGKLDEKYFDLVPKNWSAACRDVMLGLLYYPQTSKIHLNQSVNVQIWLSTPPHQINGNDTVTIQWKSSECSDCFTLSPKELSFNIENFQERQILTITRVKVGPKTSLIPIFNGGGFDRVPAEIYPILIE